MFEGDFIMTVTGVSLSEHAAERIRKFILTGQIKPGERLNIDGMARTLNTSKTPVREAMNMLAAERLVAYRPKIGYYVPTMTVAEFLEMSEVQEALELYICMRIIRHRRQVDFAAAEAINDQIDLAIRADDPIRIFNLNEEFHMTIYRCCGNEKIVHELRRIWNEMLIHRYHMFSSPIFLSRIVSDHAQIMEALKAWDVSGVTEAVRRHFINGNRGTTEGLDREKDAI